MNIDFTQIMIAITGCLAIYLTQQNKAEPKRYACIVGLLGQPFWIYVTFTTAQWEMFTSSILYTLACFVGYKNNWIKRKERMIYKPGGVLHSIVWVK